MATLLVLTAGPYFWVNQRPATLKYELLSEHFDGFILSFISRKEWRRAKIGRFELVGRPISTRLYGIFLVRLLVRIVFILGTALRLHYWRKRLDVVLAPDPFMTGLLAYVIGKLTGARVVVEVNNDFANSDNWGTDMPVLVRRLKALWVSRVGTFTMRRAHCVKLLYPTQVDAFYRASDPGQIACFHDFVATSHFEPKPPAPLRTSCSSATPGIRRGSTSS